MIYHKKTVLVLTLATILFTPQNIWCMDTNVSKLTRTSSSVRFSPEAQVLRSQVKIETFFKHIRDGLTYEVEAMLQQDPTLINEHDASYNTPLKCAISCKYIFIPSLLCRCGADPNQRAYPSRKIPGIFLLELFTAEQELEMMEILLECGANPDLYEQRCGCPPLRRCAARGFIAGVQLLLEYGANPFTCLEKSNHSWGYIVPKWITNEIARLLTDKAPEFRWP